MRRQGVSILYVSHAMETVLAVCDKVIWLDHGRIHGVGNPTDVVTSYLRSVELPPPTTPDSAELRLRGGSAAELGARPE
jgi:lipopolysaccharide transport system ATP-binding protein